MSRGIVLMPPESPFAGRTMDIDSDEFDASLPDPLALTVAYLDRSPQWLILGGLGDCDDVGPAAARWPDARIIGIDPDPRAIRWQLTHNWPKGSRLLQEALSDTTGTVQIFMDTLCCASMHPDQLAAAPAGALETVRTTTLDRLETLYGPFDDAIVWLDLEGYDLRALQGAPKLLTSGRALLVNVEVRYRNPEDHAAMHALLTGHGYRRVLVWCRQWWGHNELYKLDGRAI